MLENLMLGIFNKNSPKPRYTSTWNVNVVLEFFELAADNNELDLLELSQKLAMLLASSLLLRVADLAAFDFKSIVWSENDVALHLVARENLKIKAL